MPRLEPFRDQEIFIISSVSTVQIWVFRVFFFAVWLIFCSLDLTIFADPDRGSQNLLDSTELAPKH